MKVDSYQNAYAFCAVNIGYNLLDLEGDIIAYGSSFSVALYSLQQKRVLSLLKGHTGEVNSVRFFGTNRQHITSASDDKSVIIWSKVGDEYEIKHVLKHASSVTLAECVEYNGRIYTFSTARDKVFRVWQDGELICEQQNKGFTLDIKVYSSLKLFPGLIVLQANSEGKILFQRFDETTKELKTLTVFTGQTDWIRTVDLHENATSGRLFIASGSQDFTTRVHSIVPFVDDNSTSALVLHQSSFSDNDKKFTTECVTIQYTHDMWVNAVRWFTTPEGVLSLLTASSDRTMIVWQEIETTGENSTTMVWQEMARFGEFGGVQMGFNGCVIDPTRNLVLGYNFLGAIEVWKQKETIIDWEQTMSITGHYQNVTDLVWEPAGEYFLTCSEDRTTRLHSRLKATDTWHELARAQVHGHALKCLAMASPIKLVSGSEEKVIRVFNATKYFIQSLKNLSGVDLLENRTISGLNEQEMAEYATVPALGLSNSAVYQQQQKPSLGGDVVNGTGSGEEAGSGEQQQQSFVPKVLEHPPIEEILEQNTLWPEAHKLYGHGFELFSMAVNSTGTLLASACRAQSLTHASIIVWNLENYDIIAHLKAHNLTITQLKFSPDDKYLLSVSRDRTWNLFLMEAGERFGERIAQGTAKTGGHARIIWDAAWTRDSKVFVTVARDNKAMVWNVDDLARPSGHVLVLGDSITSVDILNSSQSSGEHFVAAFGMENGAVEMYEFDKTNGWTSLSDLTSSWHTATVNRVRFSPKVQEADGQLVSAALASCGVDKAVKLTEIKFHC